MFFFFFLFEEGEIRKHFYNPQSLFQQDERKLTYIHRHFCVSVKSVESKSSLIVQDALIKRQCHVGEGLLHLEHCAELRGI